LSMLSDKQLAANRANAQKSTGPRTEEGKQRTRLNACHHNLTGQILVLTPEQQPAYDSLKDGFIHEFAPATEHERQLVAEYTTNVWRRQRAGNIEEGIFAIGMIEGVADNIKVVGNNPEVHQVISNSKTFLDHPSAFSLLTIYSQRLINQGQKILKQLKECQAERKNAETNQMLEAVTQYKYHQMLEIPFEPEENGFVFSNSQIIDFIRRDNVHAWAFRAERCNFVRERFNKRYPKAAA